MRVVNVRWFDGYLETFEVVNFRSGSDYIWVELSNGSNRWIPVQYVRWFSVCPDIKEVKEISK